MLRAIKPVLRMAGTLRHAALDADEELAVIVALQNNNEPKLVGDDQNLFRALLDDLFPGIVTKSSDCGARDVVALPS